ncbi:MAG: ABC transporter ATP-binding protein [Bacteroidetes bacterium CG12_big_fil_rev_8_21_14_0_65_60_17]|nr:MAG: ABC transporter ATP-binding protein [Bacteroidetes bacterium CG12_big_fil_rev_8_21_14_0_65_60_17]
MGPLSRLNSYYWTYRHLFIPGLLFAVISSVFAMIVPTVVRRAIDAIPQFVVTWNAVRGTPVESLVYWDLFSTLAFMGVAIVGLSILSGIFSFLMRQTVVVASRHIEFDLRNRLYDHLQRLSSGFYMTHPTGDLITRSTSDIEQVRRYIGPAIMYTTRAVVTIGTALTVMFVISPKLTLYALIPMPFLGLSVFLVARMVHVRSDRLQAQYSVLSSRVQEALAGIRVVKAYASEAVEEERFKRESAAYRERSLDLARVEAAWRPVFVFLVGLSSIFVVWKGGALVIEGSISLGNIAEYMIYVALMTWPVASMGFVITMVQRASASMTRLGDVFDAEPEIAGPLQPGDTRVRGEITFEHVSYRYPDTDQTVLDGISLHIPAGTTVAIVGRTGSGKTTLMELIPRLVDPVAGRVLVDGRDVREWPLEALRAGIGYVPQDVFLFSDTVGNNIRFGRMDADQEALREAVLDADLADAVEAFPKKYETFVGERGITLSGGQKQRVSLARALIREAPILLLDDALSAVDTGTERAILERLQRHYGRRTVVLVTHRVSAAQSADQILVLDEGAIVERGTHAQLEAAGGFYAALCRKQQLEAELEAMA